VGELERAFARGVQPEFDRLEGWEFRGFNPPLFARLLGFQKFKKGFFRQDLRGERVPAGYNIPIVQNGPEAPWICKPSDEHPNRFGFYRVGPASEAGHRAPKMESLFLDYGSGGNAAYDPTRFIRDFLVQVSPDNPDVCLGKAYIAVGPVWVSTNFFILERDRRAP
jgi:hypothetical protein